MSKEIKKMSKEKRFYWCPTCKKLLTVESDSPVICGSPICAICNGQVWKKNKEWIDREKLHGRLPNG